jgi:hypothetical protein
LGLAAATGKSFHQKEKEASEKVLLKPGSEVFPMHRIKRVDRPTTIIKYQRGRKWSV